MNYLSLRYFLEIAQHLSFSQASKNLHISQPGLSQQISSLEEQLGFKLLNRNTRKVTLTEEGKYLFKEIAPSFQGIERTINYMEKNKFIPNAKVKIASVPSAASIYVPGLLNKMLNDFPKVEFSLYETTSSRAIELVKEQKCHVSFIRTPVHTEKIENDGLNLIELNKNTLKFVVSKDHRLACKKSINLNEAENEYFIHYDHEYAPSLQFLLEKACLTSGFSPKKICTGSELLTIANLVSNNLGVALMPNDMIDLMDTSKVRVLDIENMNNLTTSISIVWKKNNTPSLVTNQVIRTIKEYLSHNK